MKKISAVEWLYNNLKSHFEHNGDLLEVVQFSFNQAKEMHKQEIMDAYEIGSEDWCDGFYKADISAEQYYNETFNKI